MKAFALACLIVVCTSPVAHAREQLRAAGSSTVFPFVAAAAERFGYRDEYKTPIVESTGTGGGFKLFCSGIGEDHPDISNASRAIKPAEIELCKSNGVTEITEIMLGYDGIVLANALESIDFDVSKPQLFLALAYQVPDKNGKLVLNHYERWNEIDPTLPDQEISIYGPPPTSGTRDAFVELVMEEGCKSYPEFATAYPDIDEHKNQCTKMREDGRFVEAGENDNLIVQKLTGNPDALGIFGFSFLDQNATLIKANKIGGVFPAFEKIVTGEYGVARSLFVYFKNQHRDIAPGLREFAQEITSDNAVGEDGYLILKGLIPLPPEKLAESQAIAAELRVME